jgi:hypothetical protein
MLDIKDLYQQRVANCADKFIKIVLNPLELQYILSTAAAIVDAKTNETSYKKDGASMLKRYVNGLKGEAAVGKHLGIPIINPDVGVSIDFDNPDIPGYNVGVKTVEYGNFPVIPKINNYPQIICICHPNANNVVYICGLANVTVLQKYQHDDLLLDPNLKVKGSKTGFWGFSELQEVSLKTIEPYKLPDSLVIGETSASFEPCDIAVDKVIEVPIKEEDEVICK